MSTKMSYQQNTNDFTLVIYVTGLRKPVLSTQYTYSYYGLLSFIEFIYRKIYVRIATMLGKRGIQF